MIQNVVAETPGGGPAGKAKAKTKARVAPGYEGSPADLDPSVVAAARAAGVSEGALAKGRGSRLRAEPASAMVPDQNLLDESEEEPGGGHLRRCWVGRFADSGALSGRFWCEPGRSLCSSHVQDDGGVSQELLQNGQLAGKGHWTASRLGRPRARLYQGLAETLQLQRAEYSYRRPDGRGSGLRGAGRGGPWAGVGPSLGRVQVQDRSLSFGYVGHLDHGGGRASRRAVAREPSASPLVPAARAPQHRGRVQPVAGPTLVRGRSPEGAGRVLDQKDPAWSSTGPSDFKRPAGRRNHNTCAQAAAPDRKGCMTVRGSKVGASAAHCDAPQPPPPGSRAPSFSVPALLNSLPRVLLRFGGLFGSFLRTSFADGARTAPTCHTWPCPMPYPKVFRDSRGAGAWKLKSLCIAVAALSWLYLGKPACCPAEIRIGVPLNRTQKGAVRRLEAAMFGTSFPFSFAAADLGRHASKVEAQNDVLAALARAAVSLSRECGYLGKPPDVTIDSPASQSRAFDPPRVGASQVCGVLPGSPIAQPIIASRIKLPGPPKFKPQAFMDAATAARYERPLDFCRHPAECPEPPKVKILAKVEERLLLLRALADTKRLVPGQRVPGREDYGAGLFAVVKNELKDRLIRDARPANLLEEGVSLWTRTLASAVAVSNLVLEPHRTMLFSGADLRDCFYQFVAPPGRVARNFLTGWLDCGQASFVFRRDMKSECDDLGRVYVAFASLAMGDSGACEYTQCSHLGVCLKGAAIVPGELLVHAAAPPRGLLSIGLVIDDLVCLDQVLTADLEAIKAGASQTEGSRRLDFALKAYDSAPLEVSPDKVFRDQVKASFWGAAVCGASGWLKPNAHRLWPLVMITVRTVQLGLATRHLLESLAGCWISVFILKRRLLASMDLIFKACAVDGPNTIIRLSPALRSELASFAILGPLCSVNLRAQIDTTVTATDASSGWQAAARAEIPETVAREAYRHSVQKGTWTRLLSQPGARDHGLLDVESELAGGDVFTALPLYVGLATCPRYCELWRKSYKSKVHINVAELQAFLREEARAGQRKPNSRFIFALDSQVAIGAVAKGRSASYKLNELLCRSIPGVLGSQSQSVPVYFPSACNPADDPTRDREVRPPVDKPPNWWLELCAGNPGPLEEVTEAAGFGRDGESFDQRQLFALCSERPPARESASSRKREAWRAARVHRSPLRQTSAAPAPCSPAAGPASAQLPEALASVLEALPVRLFRFRKQLPDLRTPGALCLWPGRGGVVRELLRQGCPWALVLDPLHCVGQLDATALQQRLLELTSAGAFRAVCAAPPGSSFSRARVPALRGASAAYGFESEDLWVAAKVKKDNALNGWLARLRDCCLHARAGYTIECPDASLWWTMPGWEAQRAPSSQEVWRLDFCRFGTPWRKRTRVATNTALRGARLLCCNKDHLRLFGFSKAHQKPWTSVADAHPRGFSRAVAVALACHAGWCDERPLDPLACAKLQNCCRAGEAANPGPRAPRARDLTVDLETRPLYSEASSFLGLRAWTSFLAWCAQTLSFDPLPMFHSCPPMLAMALRSFGNYLYRTGGSLQTYRYAIVAGQRINWCMRGQLGPAWELVSRWEKLQPIRHRTPIPEVVLKSLVVLAWCKGFRRWAGCTLVAYFGLARIGEILRATRAHLLLPADHCSVLEVAFVRLEGPKSAARGGPKVQHLKVDEALAVQLLGKAFSSLDSDDKLYPFGPAAYRARWNFLLGHFGLRNQQELTPGGLRGGGAVWAYHRGHAVSDIQWRMRLRHQHTLSYYLQEVAAINSVLAAGVEARHVLQCSAQLFPFLAASP